MKELNNSDYEVFEEMKSLELIIAFHKQVVLKKGFVDYFSPIELRAFATSDRVKNAWDSQDYVGLRMLYAEAWVYYYENLFQEPVVTEIADIAVMFARD